MQRELAFPLSQVLRRLGGHTQKGILRRARHVILNLRDQRRHQVEVLVHVGKLIQQFHHAVIVFQGMQPHPRQAVLAGDQILVQGLVLMPEQDQAEGRHGWKAQDSMAFGAAGGTEVATRK